MKKIMKQTAAIVMTLGLMGNLFLTNVYGADFSSGQAILDQSYESVDFSSQANFQMSEESAMPRSDKSEKHFGGSFPQDTTKTVFDGTTEEVTASTREVLTESTTEVLPEGITEAISESATETLPEGITEAISESATEILPESTTQALSVNETEDLPQSTREAPSGNITGKIPEETAEVSYLPMVGTAQENTLLDTQPLYDLLDAAEQNGTGVDPSFVGPTLPADGLDSSYSQADGLETLPAQTEDQSGVSASAQEEEDEQVSYVLGSSQGDLPSQSTEIAQEPQAGQDDFGKGTPQDPIDHGPDQYAATPTPSPSFEVTKTAMTSQARPGDTVRYEIAIKNTGQVTLHSVVSTEKFVGAGVKAYFEETEGLLLNNTRTQALLSQIEPGETATLKAYVVIPRDAQAQQLVNQVDVTAEETGSQIVNAQAAIPLVTDAAATPATGYSSGGSQGNAQERMSTNQGAAVPKTGDNTPIAFYIALLILTLATIFSLRILIRRP